MVGEMPIECQDKADGHGRACHSCTEGYSTSYQRIEPRRAVQTFLPGLFRRADAGDGVLKLQSSDVDIQNSNEEGK